MESLNVIGGLHLKPKQSLCDSCTHAYNLAGGYTSIGSDSYKQRYCEILHIAIHFGGKDECSTYDPIVQPCSP